LPSRTLGNQLDLSFTNVVYTVDQKIKQPKVHQVSVSVEREIGWDIAVEGRYVSTMGRGVWRGIDLNQNNAAINKPFFDDFTRARNNGYLALSTPVSTPGCTAATCGVFNPAYNPSLPGSQPLTVIPGFGAATLLANGTVRTLLQQGQVGSLADFFVAGNTGAAFAQTARAYFYPNGNPGIYAADLILNGGTTDYHSFQGEVRRRFKNGIFGQMNYTFSKVLTNSPGTTQARFEPYLDNARPQLERNRADFDVTHVLNSSIIVELPFGKSKRFLNSNNVLDRLVGGWQVSSIVQAQSGAPISILSGRGTFNRGGRSGGNPVNSSLSRSQIKNLFGIVKQADGRVFYINPSVTDPATGRAVGPDTLNNAAGFSGQVFFHPTAGNIGNLQRLQFDGPSQAKWDFSIIKRTRITEGKNLEIRADFFNFLNHPLFFVGDYNVDSAAFGRITGLNFAARVTQISMRFTF
jgi:hypothetical protein